MAAVSMALAAMMSLYSRLETGEGQYVDVSMVESFIGLVGHVVLDYTINGRLQESLGNRDYVAVQGCYRCAGDDQWIIVTVTTDEEWAALARCSARPRARAIHGS